MSRIIVNNVTKNIELTWRGIKIRKSLDDICHTLELEIPAGERKNVRRHDLVQVRYENPLVRDSGGRRLVTTVRVDEIVSSADVSQRSATVIGRSPARDIIDSTWGEMIFDMTLFEIVKHVCDKFGLACNCFPKNKGDITKNVMYFTWENESPWTKLVTEADSQGLMITSNEAGGLYVWAVASGARSEGFHLTEGQNIKTLEWRENAAEQFHEYVVKGFFSEAIEIDDTCPNKRVLTINLTDPEGDPEHARRRAKTEMCRRKEKRATVTVPGWGLTDSQLKKLGDTTKKEIFWIPNSIIPVSIPSEGLSDTLLIYEVEHEADAETMRTTIGLVNREAYL